MKLPHASSARPPLIPTPSAQSLSPPTVRRLKIETEGDAWKGLIKPKIRLMGRWLEQAGFKPGSGVQVTCVAPGVIELRASPSGEEYLDNPSLVSQSASLT